jgi:hypothetical protein
MLQRVRRMGDNDLVTNRFMYVQPTADETDNIEVHQDSYFLLFAALLNVSVLRAARPILGQKGLQVWSTHGQKPGNRERLSPGKGI